MVNDLEALENGFKYIKIFFAVVAIAYICHLFACMWFYISTLGQDTGQAAPGGWVDKAGIVQASNTRKYLFSVYWAITVLSTVGYGDVVANTDPEKVFSIVAELLGCVIFATLIGERKRSFLAIYTSNRSFHQDRLGTNIGKVEKRYACFAGGLGSIMASKSLLEEKVDYQLEELRVCSSDLF
jgi:hypothetical protein